MTIQVKGPDGAIVQFPDGTDNAVMEKALREHYAIQAPQPAPQQPQVQGDGQGGFQDYLALRSQQKPLHGGMLEDIQQQTQKGLVTSLPNLAAFPAQAGQWLGEKTANGIAYLRGVPQDQIDAGNAKANEFLANQTLNPANLGTNAAAMTGIGEPRTFAGGVANTAANILPTMMTGGGEISIGQKIASAIGAGTGNEAVKRGIPDTVAAKPYLQFGAAVLGGGGAHAASEMMQPSAASIIAKSVQSNPKSLSTVAQSIGDIPAARATAQSLGPEAMVANLTPQATQDARALAAMSLPNSPKIQSVAQSILDNSGNRASQDWQSVTGPAMSRYDKTLELTKQKLAASSPYEAAKALEIDATPVYQILPKMADKMKFNSQASSNIDELTKMVTDQYKGHDNLHNAGDLLGVRQRIDEMIRSAGSGQTVTPGADLYQLGSHTQTGRALLEIRSTINDTLHSDPRMAIADSIFAGAEKQKSAFELGNKNIIGSGDNAIEPQLLTKQFDAMPAEAKRAVLEGLARKGQNAIGNVKPNRNEGKAMADAFATENNLARLDAMGLNSGAVKNMAAREDALAASNGRIIGGSDTARTDITKQKFPAVGQPVGSSLDSMVNFSTFGLSALAKKGIQKIVDSYRFNKNNAAADLLSRQGDRATALLDAIDKLNISSQDKSAIFKRLAQQSAISGTTSQLTNSDRR